LPTETSLLLPLVLTLTELSTVWSSLFVVVVVVVVFPEFVTSSPAAMAPSPEAITASWLNIWETSPLAQMFWFTDWSVIVSRSSMVVV